MDHPVVTALDFFTARSSPARPITDATHRIPAINFIIARVTLADGTTGEGYLLVDLRLGGGLGLAMGQRLAAALRFLLSPAATRIPGHELAVDGGALAHGF